MSSFQFQDLVYVSLPEHADAYRLRLSRQDMFSLSFDHAEQSIQVRDLFHVCSELRATTRGPRVSALGVGVFATSDGGWSPLEGRWAHQAQLDTPGPRLRHGVQ